MWLLNPYRFGGWTPAAISTALWLDAADASTITTVSGAVSEWRDKSGNGRHAAQVTAGNRPTYTASGLNQKPVLTFNPENPSTMTLPPTALGGATEATLFWVQKSTNDPASSQLSGGSFISMEFGGGQGGSNHLPWTDGVVYFQAFSTQRKTIGNLAQSLSSPRIFAVESKNNLFNFLIDGTVAFNTATNTYLNPSTSKLIGTGSVSLVYNFSGYAAECIVIDTILSTNNRQQIEGYLAHKWGLTANLPSDHPYKSVAP